MQKRWSHNGNLLIVDLHKDSDSQYFLFIAKHFVNDLGAHLIAMLDDRITFDEIYWDFEYKNYKFTLHRHYMGGVSLMALNENANEFLNNLDYDKFSYSKYCRSPESIT
jgi:hypothetical protein